MKFLIILEFESFFLFVENFTIFWLTIRRTSPGFPRHSPRWRVLFVDCIGEWRWSSRFIVPWWYYNWNASNNSLVARFFSQMCSRNGRGNQPASASVEKSWPAERLPDGSMKSIHVLFYENIRNQKPFPCFVHAKHDPSMHAWYSWKSSA